MIHPNTELRFINEDIGYGVVATSFLRKGTITWVLDEFDREFTKEQFLSMSTLYKNILDKYSYRNNKGNYVLCWDHARYVNHSFKSNCLTTAYDFEIAVRDIYPGEQLTDDYGYLNIESPFEPIDEGTNRKVVYPNDLLNYATFWDAQLQDSFKEVLDTEQPLKPFLNSELWDKIIAISNGKEQMKSIVHCYYNPQ